MADPEGENGGVQAQPDALDDRPEGHQTSPADEIDKAREHLIGRPSEPVELSDEVDGAVAVVGVGEGLGDMQHGPTADYGEA